MSDLGLLSRVHGSFEDFVDLVDEALAELQAGRVDGGAAGKLRSVLEEVSAATGDDASLQALVFASILSTPTGIPLDDFGDLARQLANPESGRSLQQRVSRLSMHLERERAALAHRLRR